MQFIEEFVAQVRGCALRVKANVTAQQSRQHSVFLAGLYCHLTDVFMVESITFGGALSRIEKALCKSLKPLYQHAQESDETLDELAHYVFATNLTARPWQEMTQADYGCLECEFIGTSFGDRPVFGAKFTKGSGAQALACSATSDSLADAICRALTLAKLKIESAEKSAAMSKKSGVSAIM